MKTTKKQEKKNAELQTCSICGKSAEEVCRDLVCRECHESLSFEECVNGSWTKEYIKKHLK